MGQVFSFFFRKKRYGLDDQEVPLIVTSTPRQLEGQAST